MNPSKNIDILLLTGEGNVGYSQWAGRSLTSAQGTGTVVEILARIVPDLPRRAVIGIPHCAQNDDKLVGCRVTL